MESFMRSYGIQRYRNIPEQPYPFAMVHYVKKEYQRLKTYQRELNGQDKLAGELFALEEAETAKKRAGLIAVAMREIADGKSETANPMLNDDEC